jgi:gluconolactonase
MLAAGCGGDGGSGQPVNTAGSSSAGSGTAGSPATGGTSGSGGAAGSSSGGSASGGSSGSSSGAGGSTAGGSGGGAGGTGGGAGGSGGAAGGSGSMGFTCPAGPFEKPAFGTPVRVEGVPPADDFNNNNNNFTNIEGVVWVGDAVYVSEIGGGNNPPPSRILKVTADGQVSIAVPNSGTNGLAINAAGELFGAKHSDGTVSKIAMPGGTATPVASMFMGARFGSPNDLTIHSNGTIYFTDPSYQAPSPNPQTATRVYRVAPGGMPTSFEDQLGQPNGITLSKKQDVLYVAGNSAIKKFPVMADGSVGTGTTFVQGGSSDGMAVDCADNVYTTKGQTVTVYDSSGASIGTLNMTGLQEVTNVAFGGADHKTLYVTGQGGMNQKGLFKVPMNVPGFPY